ncbi:aminotransferase class I/II-fold pyridoxal phosphate-dependent enzyme [Desulfallas sp. Bu1-1]|jgi:aminotransferase|uniref:aminotransferase class I/II-fold pyridoxal phosphate-dependent enzyme n=1 Tax=Desulfallas sp. Bu1-1 TaxID=2787620 RepID=UPI0018A11151|nr:aminotransferase class I/II-fold pyridoxal phosphate-dependent enzyme [Desulfallas sp. Bu1-1]MBF7081484.1 aminotransferase class I/II-fold pyridoxal phosphate-dependent enzyme [Desulfallas sp. Bu1-1]
MTQNKWAAKINPAVRNIPPSGIRKFFDLVAETRGVISLGVGEPDFVTPWHIREACIYSLEKGYTMYTSNWGLLELREAVAADLEATYGVKYNPRNEILITVGVSEALDLAMRALLQPGDEVLIPEPSYVSYAPCTTLAGGTPVFLPTGLENGFRLSADQVQAAITPRTKILLLCYPNNPTGAVMDRAELARIAEVAVEHDLIVISDEIYDRLTYVGRHTCMASLPGMRDRTVLLNGFSKAYAMTGWRVGYAAGNPEFIGAMVKIHQYSMLCTSITGQMAALEALKNGKPGMRRMVEHYNRRRHLVVQAFKDMGVPCFEPGGAFYAFPQVSVTGLGSEEFAGELLKEEQVALVPGNAFGRSGEGFARVSYAASLDDLSEAFRRMARFVRRRGVRPRVISTPLTISAL